MRKFCGPILLSLLFFCSPAVAQEADSVHSASAASVNDMSPREFRDLVRRQAFNRRQQTRAAEFEYSLRPSVHGHDIRLTVGFGPLFDGWRANEWDEQDLWNPAYEVLRSKYHDSFFGRHCFAAVSAAYAYRVSRRCEIGVSVSYTGYRNSLTGVSDGVRGTKLREHYLTVMPMLRLLWVDRSMVRFYSGVEIGPQLAMRRGFFETSFASEMRCSGQFTYAGVTVGRKWFFNAELGVGCRGFVNLGIGWRIDTKTGKR